MPGSLLSRYVPGVRSARSAVRLSLDRAQQAVPDRQQRRNQLLALAHRPQQLPDAYDLGGLRTRINGAAVGEDALEDDQATRTQQAQRFSEIVEKLQPVTVAEDQVIAGVGEAGQDVQGAARDEAGAVAGEAGGAEGLETPVPVPISATALASTVAASIRSAAPVPGDTERSPASRARSRAQRRTSSSAT